MKKSHTITRRSLLTGITAAAAAAPLIPVSGETLHDLVTPPEGKRILLSVKLTMIADNKTPIADRLSMAGDAGLDGVDFDEAGQFTIEEAREAVRKSGVFVHNAINHAHWNKRFSSSKAEDRETAHKNLAHCIRLSHAVGGNGVLVVPGHGKDGTIEECKQRMREGLSALIPLAAALGQPILFENVWNNLFYDHDKPAPPEQSVEQHVEFIDSFKSPWVGEYFDIGNHWKYGQPGDWIRGLGHRCVKLDIKGFSRAKDEFTDIGEDDLPWADVRKALGEINFTGWATAEVDGGDVARLKKVREQMEVAFGL